MIGLENEKKRERYSLCIQIDFPAPKKKHDFEITLMKIHY